MWTVPRPVLRLVALLLLACAAGAFTLGVIGAEPRGGRLPGEAAPGAETAAVVNATEAQALDPDGASLTPVQAPAESEAEVEPAQPSQTPAADPQVPALQVPDEAAPAPKAPPAPAPKAPAPKAAPPAQNGDAIGDLVDGLSELPPF